MLIVRSFHDNVFHKQIFRDRVWLKNKGTKKETYVQKCFILKLCTNCNQYKCI